MRSTMIVRSWVPPSAFVRSRRPNVAGTVPTVTERILAIHGAGWVDRNGQRKTFIGETAAVRCTSSGVEIRIKYEDGAQQWERVEDIMLQQKARAKKGQPMSFR